MERQQPSTAVGHDLLSILPGERVSQGAADRLVYSRDMWPRALLSVRDNKPSVHPPDYIVWPESSEEVAEILRVAARHKVGVIPYGGGSGVCGGAMAVTGGVILDLKRMNHLVDVSSADHLATFETGVNGQLLEDQLNLRGLTLGHFPASIYCSTLGGWLAARSAGQLSSRYGKIEDMVHGLEVVLGDGRIVQCEHAHEPDLIPLFVGSEGTLGVITRATMRVNPLPDYRVFRAYEFPRVAAGCEAMRRAMQRGLQPAVMRLYDEVDTLLARPGGDRPPPTKKRRGLLDAALGAIPQLIPQLGDALGGDLKSTLFKAALSRAGMLNRVVETFIPRLSGGCLAILGFEGEQALVEAEAALAHAEYLEAGGKDLGEGPGLAWYKHRYSVSYKMSPVYANGGFVDTMEVATTWDRLMDLYREVRKALSPLAVVLAHFSHAYPEGCSIYFSFAASAEGRVKSDALYDEIWRTGLSAVIKAGGTISHHHGVGQSKAAFMQEEHGASMGVYRQLKAVMDPAGVLNPGKMGL
jgi:alkyldihydroxyacetonephosphate synthase